MRTHVLSIDFGKALVRKSREDRVTTGAAALAFYSILALFPAAIFLLTVAAYLPIPHLERAVMDLLHQAMPGQAADLFTDTVNDVVRNRRPGLLSFGFLFTVWSASSGMYAVMQQLDATHDVVEHRSLLKARGTAIALTIVCALLVIVAFSLVVFGGGLQDVLARVLGWSGALGALFALVRWIVIAFALLFALAILYKFAPDVDREFKLFTPGTIFGTIGLAVASLGFRLYVDGFGTYDKVYGSLGAIIVLLLWLDVAGLVLLVGSEIDALTEPYRTRGNVEPGTTTGAAHAEPA